MSKLAKNINTKLPLNSVSLVFSMVDNYNTKTSHAQLYVFKCKPVVDFINANISIHLSSSTLPVLKYTNSNLTSELFSEKIIAQTKRYKKILQQFFKGKLLME